MQWYFRGKCVAQYLLN